MSGACTGRRRLDACAPLLKSARGPDDSDGKRGVERLTMRAWRGSTGTCAALMVRGEACPGGVALMVWGAAGQLARERYAFGAFFD